MSQLYRFTRRPFSTAAVAARGASRIAGATAALGVLAVLAVLSVSALLVSCNGSGSAINGGASTLRVANLALGAPSNFDVLQGSTKIATDLAFDQATAFATTSTGGSTLTFDPTGTTTATLTDNITIAAGTNYSVLEVQGSSALTYLNVGVTATTPASGQVQLSFVNATPAIAGLDIYVVAPGTTLPLTASVTPQQTDLVYPGDGASASPTAVNITAGEYRVLAVKNGDTTFSIVYDSGPLVFASGATPLLVFVPVTGSASVLGLVSLDASSNVATHPDQRVQVRVGNYAPATAAVDTYFTQNGAANSSANVFATSIVEGAAAAYQPLYPGAYHASFTNSGQITELVGSDVALAAGSSVSVFSIGVLNATSPDNLKLLVVQDDLRAPATGMAKLRLVQLSPDLGVGGPIDLLSLSVSGSTTTVIGTLVGDLAYGVASPYVTVSPGNYTVAVAATGTHTTLLPSSAGVTVTLAANSITTLVVSGCEFPSVGLLCSNSAMALSIVPLND